MPKPYIHAVHDSKRFGGSPEDYLPIHELMDSSKSVFPDNRHRALTHNTWFIFLLEKIFGSTIINSDGKVVSTRDIGESHCLLDFSNRFIPTPQDYLENMEMQLWMNNGMGNTSPPSTNKQKIETKKVLRD